MTESPEEHCARELKRLDPDRWLTCLFAPDDRRAGLFALYAFNSEIARARESVSQPMIGQIRLQWWREAWEGIVADKPRQHPVVLALHAHCRSLDQAQVQALIDSRERDMEDHPLSDMAALLAYAEGTSAPLMRLAAQQLDARTDRDQVRTAGTAYALTGILRATPHLAMHGRVLLPAALLGAYGLTPDAVVQTDVSAKLPLVIRTLAEEAERLLQQAAAGRPSRQALPALLPATLARLHLKAMRASGYDPAVAETRVTPLRKQMALLWASLRGRI